MAAMLPVNLLWGLLLLGLSAPAPAAAPPAAWDNDRDKNWGPDFEEVEIPSSADGSKQKAMWHGAPGPGPRPLVVSLHTWSGDYRQADPLAAQAVARGFHYLHPDFRGPNRRPEACGSDLVVADIDDAIAYALAHAPVDPANIHLIGVSGGGHATMLAWMRSRHAVRSFSAWVGIADLVKWHAESLGRGTRYAEDLEKVTTGEAGRFDPAEAARRSPVFMDTPRELRARSQLLLFAGVHDGYTGSVPVTHSIDFFNKVVADLAPGDPAAAVPWEVAEALLRQRGLPGPGGSTSRPAPGSTIYEKSLQDRVRLTIFEGGHEMLTARALDHVPAATAPSLGAACGEASDG